MKRSLAALAVAAAIPLFLNSPSAGAAEPSFSAPLTARAQESAELLARAAHALYASPTAVRDQHISNLWLFPTGDAKTVFAHYTLSSNDESKASTEQLAMLTLSGTQLVEQRDLTIAQPNWSAAIGNGHTSSTTSLPTSHGAPTAAHWTAKIGTGTATARPTDSSSTPAPSVRQHAVADAHWTSKIGTGVGGGL
jgi:hypothetical protein